MSSRQAMRIGAPVIVWAVAISVASGAVDLPVTLEGYLSRALAENPRLALFGARYEAATARVPQVSALPDPTVEISHFVEPIQTRTGPQEQAVAIAQGLPWFGTLDRRERAADAEADALGFRFEAERLELAREVAHAFFEYGFVARAIELTRENRDWLATLEPVIEERVKGGGDLNPLLRLKVEIGMIDDALRSLERDRRVASAGLGELLALPDPTIFPFPEWSAPEREPFDAASVREAIRQTHPELLSVAERARGASARADLAQLERYPDFKAGVRYVRIGEPELAVSTPDAGRDAWAISLSLNVPLWSKRNRAARAEAAAELRVVRSEERVLVDALEASLRASVERYDDAHRRLELYGDELLGLAEQAVENSLTSYQGGRTGILEVIDSERSLLDLQLRYWRAAADAWKEWATLRALEGRLPTRAVLEPSSAGDGR